LIAISASPEAPTTCRNCGFLVEIELHSADTGSTHGGDGVEKPALGHDFRERTVFQRVDAARSAPDK
jgi:hypothetical protein